MEKRAKLDMEVRTYTAELRVDAASYGKKTSTIRGYAAKFNSLSKSMPVIDEAGNQIGTFRELLLPGCFASALPTSDVRALFNHEPSLILGRNISGTLRMNEDEIGLAYEVDPPETSYSKDLMVSMQRGDITQCSFGFRVAKGGDTYVKDPNIANGYIRSISQMAQVFDVSPVTYPAYVDTECAVRSIISQMQNEENGAAEAISKQEEEERQRQVGLKRKRLELAERSTSVGFEKRVDMGYLSYQKVGTCEKCNEEGCLCSTCINVSWNNMHTADDGGVCTKCLEPGCLCLGCPNTDQCVMQNMYRM